MSIDWTDILEQHPLRPPHFSKTESTIIDIEINKLLKNEVIKKIPVHGGGIISNIFL